jgi:hypothetical protein
VFLPGNTNRVANQTNGVGNMLAIKSTTVVDQPSTSSSAAPTDTHIQKPTRGGGLAFKGIALVLFLLCILAAVAKHHQHAREIGMAIAFNVGAFCMSSYLIKWKRGVGGAVIGWSFAIILSFGAFIGSVAAGVPDRDSTVATEAHLKLDSANPPYEPETIVAQAERDFAVEDYNGTLQAIRELEENDRRRPVVQALFAKSSDASVKETMASYRKARLDYADDYEKSMLLAGQNMTIRAEGRDAQILTITYVLTNRSYVYILMNDRALNSKWIDMGFKTIRLSDGYEYSWSFKPSI